MSREGELIGRQDSTASTHLLHEMAAGLAVQTLARTIRAQRPSIIPPGKELILFLLKASYRVSAVNSGRRYLPDNQSMKPILQNPLIPKETCILFSCSPSIP